MFSLQSLCLNSIVDQFERFHFAFSVSKNEKLQRNSKFLRKIFSDYLAGKLLGGRNTNVYFNFLINEYLHSLCFDWFRDSYYLKSINDIFRRLPNLTTIVFHFRGDEILECVAKYCPKIFEIRASNSDVTDKGIKYLCGIKNRSVPCPNLRNIIIWRTRVTDKGVEYLIRCLPLLERVEYDNLPLVLYSLYKENLSELQELPGYNLTELNLKICTLEPPFTDVLKACLAVCPKLESFACHILEEQLNVFIGNCLKKLNLFFLHTVSYININNFLKVNGRFLTYLRISNCTVSASVLTVCCPMVEIIFTLNVNFTDNSDLRVIFPHLMKITVYGESSKALKAFLLLSSASPKLKYVLLSSDVLSEGMKDQILMRCKSLTIENIEFRHFSNIEINFLKEILLNCKYLKWMRLWICIYETPEILEMLKVYSELLPNKPKISCY